METRTKGTPEAAHPTPHKVEPYSISLDGHYVACDGFVVPKNFREYYDRNPLGVRRFVMTKMRKYEADADVEDMEQSLLLHLSTLPEKSKHRKEGKTDIIQTFDPAKHHGASEKRFFNYIKFCLDNRYKTIMATWKKNPLSHPHNLGITEVLQDGDDGDANRLGVASAECVYNHASLVVERDTKETLHNKIFIEELKKFVGKIRPELLRVLDAISHTNTDAEAQEVLGISARAFARNREELRRLAFAFKTGHGIKTPANRKHARSFSLRHRRQIVEFGGQLGAKRKKAARWR